MVRQRKDQSGRQKVQHLLDGRQYTYGTKEGKFVVENGQLLFHPKYAKNITTVWTILIFSLYAGNWI